MPGLACAMHSYRSWDTRRTWSIRDDGSGRRRRRRHARRSSRRPSRGRLRGARGASTEPSCWIAWRTPFGPTRPARRRRDGLMMPHLSGLGVLDALRRAQLHFPVILMTVLARRLGPHRGETAGRSGRAAQAVRHGRPPDGRRQRLRRLRQDPGDDPLVTRRREAWRPDVCLPASTRVSGGDGSPHHPIPPGPADSFPLIFVVVGAMATSLGAWKIAREGAVIRGT